MTRIYRYILAQDHGVAPCPDDGLITLATCKPTIRRMARPGDWVLGFQPGSLERGMLLWGGRVSATMSHGDYERAHRGRRDAVYRERRDGRYDRLDPDYHPSQADMDRDLSGPVLVFDTSASVYLNGHPATLPPELAHLAASGRGHRVNGRQDDDLKHLKGWFFATMARQKPKPARLSRGTAGERGCSPARGDRPKSGPRCGP